MFGPMPILIDNNISILLMPPHSSHLCQPLDVGVFSPLKQYMSRELDKIIRYGIIGVKKFEWADAYRKARPNAMSEANIKSAWRAAGLVPFNRRKVLVRMPGFVDADCDSDIEEINQEMLPPPMQPFTEVPETPSKIDPAILQQANKALISNIHAGILDTPTKTYIPKLVKFAEYASTQAILANHENRVKDNILKKRREMFTGKHVCLKGKYLITTERVRDDLKACENATRKRRVSRGRRRGKSATTAAGDIKEDGEGNEEGNISVIGALEEHSVADELKE